MQASAELNGDGSRWGDGSRYTVVKSAAMLERVDSASDTIVACATPPGEGAIAVVRLSGPKAVEIARRLTGRAGPERSHRLVRAKLHDAAGRLLDQGMAVHMLAPRSYTGEDIVELHTHGSRAVVSAVVEAAVECGARMARAGEFTLRAFLNGRIDLAQAEAVADLILSSSDAQLRVAAAQLAGGLSRAVEALLEPLEGILSQWRAAMDFPEDVEEGVLPQHLGALEEAVAGVDALLALARTELRRGLRVVLCGAPNVGKSTLLNAWAGHDRVLVDAAPGTTRDPVEVELSRGVTRWSVCDTAGIREHAAGVEARGIEMSREWIERADVALWLVTAEQPEWPPPELRVQVTGSKADLVAPARRVQVEEAARSRGLTFVGWVSARTGFGTEELRGRILGREDAPVAEGETVVVRRRHVEALQRCGGALRRLLEALGEAPGPDREADAMQKASSASAVLGEAGDRHVVGVRDVDALCEHGRAPASFGGALDGNAGAAHGAGALQDESGVSAGMTLDVMCIELEEACHALGEIIGRDVDGAVLDRIFSELCIGK